MMQADHLLRLLNDMSLQRLGEAEEAGLWITSLPWPRTPATARALAGRPTYGRSLGQWPDEPAGSPRRLLMVGDAQGEAPASLKVADGAGSAPNSEPPRAEAERFIRSEGPAWVRESHRLRIEQGDKSIALAMGLRTGDEVHWWEACRMVVLEETPTCRVVEMAGAIPLVHTVPDSPGDGKRKPGGQKASNVWLHKHNWLYGHIRARLHANGVCEIFAHHINSRYVDDGDELAPAVPIVGLWSDGADAAQRSEVCGTWDGSAESLELGGVRFDMAEVARLATPDKPGRIDVDDESGMVVWQPYLGCELLGGVVTEGRTGDEYVVRAEQQRIPRGLARTLRFSLSLSNRSPRVVRYLAPPWWYGVCEEFMPDALLPVLSDAERRMDAARQWVRVGGTLRGFEDGGMFRGGKRESDEDRREPGWEGEIPYAQFLSAWRYTDAEEYDLAMRSAYHFTDVAIDHAASCARMHSFPPVAFSLPMNRVQGSIAAFLETGDDYLLETAEAVVEASHRLQLHAWPRLAMGRDACYIRSAALLYRYFANEHFRAIARKGVECVADVQRDDGSFGDQGGGSGLHQRPGYITKPWMGLLATNPVLDYLELFPDEPRLLETVRRFADWLMAERVERDGVMTWAYQHDFDGKREFPSPKGTVEQLPSAQAWHHETLARLLGYCALRFNEPVYLDAWAESHAREREIRGDHPTAAALQFLPWIQAKLWQARLDENGAVQVHAAHFGPRTPQAAKVLTPDGQLELRWADERTVEAPANVQVTRHEWSSESVASA